MPAVVSDCANAILPADRVAAARAELFAALQVTTDGTEYVRKTGQLPVPPATAYAALFGEALDPYLVRRINTLYADAAAVFTRSQPGSVYVFRDARDPITVVKLGRSTRPERRLRQWRATLGLGASDHANVLVGLFTVGTQHAPLTEAVLHTLLWCRQLTARINRHTGRQLVEYFAVYDRAALRTLCQAVACHVDAFMSVLTADSVGCQ